MPRGPRRHARGRTCSRPSLEAAVGAEIVRLMILADEALHERVPPLVEPLRLARGMFAGGSFTSRDTSILSLQPSMASAATFMPIELSPGDDVYTGTPCSHAAATSDFRESPSARCRSATTRPIR